MKNSKKLINIVIASLLLNLVLITNINARTYRNNPSLEMGYVDKNGYSYYISLELNSEQIQQFKDIWDKWEYCLKNIREDNEMSLEETIEFEAKSVILLKEIKNLTKDTSTGQVYFPPNIDISSFIHSHLFMMGFGAKIFSIGKGRVWLPFNRQGEAFIGTRLNPIFITYSIGFTRVKLRSLSTFSIVISNRFFVHRVCTAGFSGLYINFEKLYPDTSFGPVILIGKPLLLGVGDDIV